MIDSGGAVEKEEHIEIELQVSEIVKRFSILIWAKKLCCLLIWAKSVAYLCGKKIVLPT